jgi:protein-disulfide isomerase
VNAVNLAGIPQSGISLGEPDAPVTIVEFSDLQCPFCREYHERAFPVLLDRYVRTGKVRMELNLLRFIGSDSDRLARTAAGAAAKDRMWNVVQLAYARQGAENSGYADDQFLTRLVADSGLEGVNAGSRAEAVVAAAEVQAHKAHIEATPSFLVGPTGGALHHFQPADLTAKAFVEALDEELAR